MDHREDKELAWLQHQRWHQTVDLDMRKHIEQCSCACNHMGYGNFMDYQATTCLSELPDVAPALDLLPVLHPPPTGPGPGGGGGGGAGGGCHAAALHKADSTSSSSSKAASSVTDAKGEAASRSGRGGWRPWCVALAVCALGAALAAGVGVGVPLALGWLPWPTSRLDAVRRLLAEVPLVDGHNDLAWNVRLLCRGRLSAVNLTDDLRRVEPWASSAWSHTDLPRLRRGLVGAQFWSAYVPCGAQHLDAVQLALEQVDLVRRMAALYPAHLAFVSSADGLVAAHRAGLVASLVGVEGGHALGNSLAVLRMLYALGARYLTLTHLCSTAWADSSAAADLAADQEWPPSPSPSPPPAPLPPSPPPTPLVLADAAPQGADPAAPPLLAVPAARRPGLTDFGRKVVREMNRLGMMVDLSHASAATMRDALAASQAPVIFSHSAVYALCNSSSNVPDDVLRALATNGGVVMLSLYPYFITCSASANITDVIAHINHIRDVAGIDHVGLGAGFDGIGHTTSGLEDVSRYPDLLAALLEDPSWSEDDVKRLAGLNLLRVFRQVEQVRDKWRLAAVTPGEDFIPAASLELAAGNCTYTGS